MTTDASEEFSFEQALRPPEAAPGDGTAGKPTPTFREWSEENPCSKQSQPALDEGQLETLKDAEELTIPRMEKAIEAVKTWDTPGMVNEVVVQIMAEAYLHSRRDLLKRGG